MNIKPIEPGCLGLVIADCEGCTQNIGRTVTVIEKLTSYEIYVPEIEWVLFSGIPGNNWLCTGKILSIDEFGTAEELKYGVFHESQIVRIDQPSVNKARAREVTV